MSRAFVKGDDETPEPVVKRPISEHPNYVTPHGLELLRAALAKAEAATDAREVDYYQQRVESAIVVEPSSHPEGIVEFGASVRAHDARGVALQIRIVGDDEAEPSRGSVSWESPIARAFTDHRVGERIVVQRPAGPIEYTIDAVSYE